MGHIIQSVCVCLSVWPSVWLIQLILPFVSLFEQNYA